MTRARRYTAAVPSVVSPVAATTCPLCGQANECAMERERATGVPQGPCWCTQADFTAELLARVPEAARDRACLCARCAGGTRAA